MSGSRRACIVLAPLVERHLDAVTRIEAEASSMPWSRELFAGELTMPAAERHWLVASRADRSPIEGDDIVGFGGMMVIDDEAHLMNVAVSRQHRRSGIARRLVVQLVLDVVELGVRHLTLEVRTDNEAALSFYRSLGMGPVGARRDYYGPGEDALILWAHDIDDPERLASITGSGRGE